MNILSESGTSDGAPPNSAVSSCKPIESVQHGACSCRSDTLLRLEWPQENSALDQSFSG